MHLPLSSTRSLRLTHPRLSAASFNPRLITADHVVRAIEHQCNSVLSELINVSPTPRAICWAAYRNNVAALQLLLPPCFPLSPSTNTLGDAIAAAAEKNNIEALALLIQHLSPPARRSDDSVANQSSSIATQAFVKSATAGHVQAMRLLEPYADPTAYQSAALRLAAASSRLPAVAFLLSATASDPAARDHQPLRHASRDNIPALVQLLLPYAPKRAIDAALACAAAKGAVDAARVLLLAGADPRAERDRAIRDAVDCGCPEMIHLLSRAVNGEGSGRSASPVCGGLTAGLSRSRKASKGCEWSSAVLE